MGRHVEAIAEYDRAITLEPRHLEAIFSRGMSLRSLWRLDEALADLNRVLERSPEEPLVLSERGAVSFLQGRYDDALNDLDRALQMQPDDEKALIVRGQTHRVLHRSQEALRDLNRLLDKRPDNDWAWYQRSLVFWQQGDDRHARQELLQAVKIATQGLERAPANQAIRMNLALYHLANGNVPTAEQHYQETLDSGARHEIILDAISDLDELLALMPDSNQMRAMRDRLSLHTGEG